MTMFREYGNMGDEPEANLLAQAPPVTLPQPSSLWGIPMPVAIAIGLGGLGILAWALSSAPKRGGRDLDDVDEYEEDDEDDLDDVDDDDEDDDDEDDVEGDDEGGDEDLDDAGEEGDED